jgi:hypothetical protein
MILGAPRHPDSVASCDLPAQGKPYPRTCRVCGLRPCARELADPNYALKVESKLQPAAAYAETTDYHYGGDKGDNAAWCRSLIERW